MWYTLGVGISWDLTIQFDSDSEVNDSILNRLLMHLDATIFFVYISMHDFKKKCCHTVLAFKEVGAGLIGLVLAIAAILVPLKHKQLAHVCTAENQQALSELN